MKTVQPERKRTNLPKKHSLRTALEGYVIAWNTCLKEAVKKIDYITLLRNAHPAYRTSFMTDLENAGLISKDEILKVNRGYVFKQINTD
jgi:hypothetical protein